MSMLRALLMTLFCAVGLWASERPAQAQVSCSFSIDNLAFGEVQTTNGLAVDVNTTLRASCSGGLLSLSPVYICPYIGAGGGGSINPDRTMANGANKLRFQLYSVAGSTIWGSPSWNGTTAPRLSVPLLSVLGLDLLQGQASWTIYGRILGNQQAAVHGNYQSVFSSGDLNVRYGTSLFAPTCSASFGTAASPQPSFTVSARVMPSCTITTNNVAFPNTGILSGNVNAQGAVNVNCSSGAPWEAKFEVPGGQTASSRKMTKGSDFVNYFLYKNNDPAQLLGVGAGQTISGTGTGSNQSTTVYGRVPPQTTPSAGTYNDTVVVTLTY